MTGSTVQQKNKDREKWPIEIFRKRASLPEIVQNNVGTVNTETKLAGNGSQKNDKRLRRFILMVSVAKGN